MKVMITKEIEVASLDAKQLEELDHIVLVGEVLELRDTISKMITPEPEPKEVTGYFTSMTKPNEDKINKAVYGEWGDSILFSPTKALIGYGYAPIETIYREHGQGLSKQVIKHVLNKVTQKQYRAMADDTEQIHNAYGIYEANKAISLFLKSATQVSPTMWTAPGYSHKFRVGVSL